LNRAANCGAAAQHLLQLLDRDRKILTVSDPGFDLIAETRPLELGDGRGEPAPAAMSTSLSATGTTAASS
jgi:hypothetical protein